MAPTASRVERVVHVLGELAPVAADVEVLVARLRMLGE